MKNIEQHIQTYLEYCSQRKRLDEKTVKAYRIDLAQFTAHLSVDSAKEITSAMLEDYIAFLHQSYQPKTVKRKIASLKALFHYMECHDLLIQNPFNKVELRFREPVILPKTIPLHELECLLRTIYHQQSSANTPLQRENAFRDAAVCELLFSTGMRISELCSLSIHDVNLYDGTILIHGKGAKERRLQLGNQDVVAILQSYWDKFASKAERCGHFFVNQNGRPLSDQSVRRIIQKYAKLAAINLHITPHMFRHTFATSLLEADVDIRYIQEMLGHSSIHITEIYTHVSVAKKRDILAAKHPRNNFHIY